MYLVRRLLMVPLVVVGVVTCVFLIMHVIPADVARLVAGPDATENQVAEVRLQLKLNRGLLPEFIQYINSAIHGDFGRSIYSHRPVLPELLPRFRNTALLALSAIALSVFLGVALGVVAAARHDGIEDSLVGVVTACGLALPSFFFGLVLILIFAEKLRVLPPVGGTDLRHMILPAMTLGIPGSASIARLTRGSMLDVLHEDYVRTAYAKGLHERRVLLRHALKPALLPVVTIVGLQLGALLGGAVVVETVFAYPGVGSWIVQSIQSRDFPVVQAGVIAVAVAFAAVNLVVDLLYAWLDPRIRYA